MCVASPKGELQTIHVTDPARRAPRPGVGRAPTGVDFGTVDSHYLSVDDLAWDNLGLTRRPSTVERDFLTPSSRTSSSLGTPTAARVICRQKRKLANDRVQIAARNFHFGRACSWVACTNGVIDGR